MSQCLPRYTKGDDQGSNNFEVFFTLSVQPLVVLNVCEAENLLFIAWDSVHEM